jgi:hypothetical protein
LGYGTSVSDFVAVLAGRLRAVLGLSVRPTLLVQPLDEAALIEFADKTRVEEVLCLNEAVPILLTQRSLVKPVPPLSCCFIEPG